MYYRAKDVLGFLFPLFWVNLLKNGGNEKEMDIWSVHLRQMSIWWDNNSSIHIHLFKFGFWQSLGVGLGRGRALKAKSCNAR